VPQHQVRDALADPPPEAVHTPVADHDRVHSLGLGDLDEPIERDPAKAREILTQIQVQAGETLEDLRDLARGIYPPLLVDEGIAAAVQAQARKVPVPVDIRPDGVRRCDQ